MHTLTTHKATAAQTKRGFTIIETLVAVMILVFAITGPMVFASQALKSAYYARDQVIAFYLSQEAIELIKNARDNNSLARCDEWLECTEVVDLSGCIDQYCVVGLDEAAEVYVDSCGSNPETCEFLKRNPDDLGTPQYAYTNDTEWIDSQYQRLIRINTIDGREGREVEVVITIVWQTGLTEREFTVRENITNWVPLVDLPVLP
jgi:prepilin-type N-terminal cleavage/methylation domain-containing protein